jgi:hypothetical protein
MPCELCRLDLLFYGSPSRHFEGLNICLGCYLDMNGSGYGQPNYRDVSLQFIRYEPMDTRLPERRSRVA